MGMRSDIERCIHNQLLALGLRKLPPAVVDALVDKVSADLSMAMAKAVGKRTTLSSPSTPAAAGPGTPRHHQRPPLLCHGRPFRPLSPCRSFGP